MDTSQDGRSADTQQQQTHELPDTRSPSSSPSAETPRVYALLIGINQYRDRNIGKLENALEDVENMKRFLLEKVHLDENRVQQLCGPDATRKSIIDHISDLGRCDAIEKNDPILIFFAGHGSQTKAPEGWYSQSDKIEMLLPYDFTFNTTPPEAAITGIPDITLSVLLHDLSIAKGNNITVILDCCHSGSATRGTGRAREVLLPDTYEISSAIFEDLKDAKEKAGSFAAGFIPHLGSHVLLAACRPTETAREVTGGGLFTSALLECLRAHGTDKLSYEGIIKRLPPIGAGQHPQCEGIHKDRVLFGGMVTSRGRVPYTALCEGREYCLQSGDAQGVSVGDEFSLHIEDDPMSQCLGRFVVRSTKADRAHLDPVEILANSSLIEVYAYPVLANRRDLRICAPGGDRQLLEVLETVTEIMDANRKLGTPSILLVEETAPTPPELIVTKHGEQVAFGIKDQLCNINKLHTIPHTVLCDSSRILGVMYKAADFYWHLRHIPILVQRTISKYVTVECYELEFPKVADGHALSPFLRPRGRNLVQDGVVTIRAPIAPILPKDMQPYGFRINNKMGCPLYAALFYFDMSNLSISPYYTPNAAAPGGEAASILPFGSLTIGFGDGGHSAQTYALLEGASVDVGHLKLFLSSFPVDFSNIAQDSPFEQMGLESGAGRKGRAVYAEHSPSWDEITIGLVQRNSVE